MKYLIIIWFGLTALIATCCLDFVNAQKPNVIIILTDDQGYGEFSSNGNPIVQTPNIDRLANEGIRFTDFHVAPMCTPTRGELLTGLDAFRNGAINVSSGRTLLRPELTTMANIFQDAGYSTGIFGKWHLGDNYPFRPGDRGFDEAIWFPSSHVNSVPDYWDNDYFDDTYIHNEKRKKYEGYCTDVFFNEAIKWMDKNSSTGTPFFTFIPLNAAHSPHFVPEKYRDPIRKSFEEHPEIVGHLSEEISPFSGTSRKEALISFLAMGANIDENMGKLNQFLEDSDLLQNTIVVFLTDNGSTFGQDYYNAGMKGRKTELWEGGHRVPLFIKTPPNISKQPATINELCHVQDLLPTLAAMVGINDIPQNLDGIDLLPLLNGKKEKLEDRMLVINYSRMPQFSVNYTTDNPTIPKKDGAAVLWKNWRFLENRELYDIINDPHQDHDIASEYPEIVNKMRNHLDNWWNGVKDDVQEVQRVVIGNEAENPTLITSCEWLNVFVDMQAQIRRGVRKNGIWHVFVDQPGEYEFELRRWPRMSGYALRDSLPAKKVTDGTFVKGVSLKIHSAKIKINEQEQSGKVDKTDKSKSFKFNLEKGETTIQTWFLDSQGESISGAYYLYVKRI